MKQATGVARRTILAATVVAAATLLGACQRTPDVVKIGVGQPLSGPLAALGRDLVNGVQLAVDEINAAGGVRIDGKVGAGWKLVTADDQADAEAGMAAAQCAAWRPDVRGGGRRT